MDDLRTHDRYPYSPITERADFDWPEGRRLAVYIAINVEWFAFGEGKGAVLASSNPQPDVLNYAWRDYGNRVGIWRMLDLLDELELPSAGLLNSAICDHAPQIARAFMDRGDEIVAHGHSNSVAPGELDREAERRVLAESRDRIAQFTGTAPSGYLAPFISQSEATPDLLAEIGYNYLLDWAHDEQPVWFDTDAGAGRILSVPYPQELNDVPQIVGRRREGGEFADMIGDAFDLHVEECARRPVVMGIALHPYLMGQAHRFGHLARALRRMKERAEAEVWFTTPGAVARHYAGLPTAP